MKKKERIEFRVSIEEKQEIKRLSEKLGYDNVSEYLSSIALSGLSKRERILLFNKITDFGSRNAQVENNINQIAKHLNTYKSITPTQFDEYLKLFRDFSDLREIQNSKLNTIIKSIYDS